MNDCVLSMLFARDLVKYVMKYQDVVCEWESTVRTSMDNQRLPSLYVVTVGKSVLNLMLLKYEVTFSCYCDLCDQNNFQDAEFGQLAIKSVPHYFPNGYTHCDFIAFCGMVIGVTVSFLSLDGKNFVHYVIGIVGNVLTASMLTGEFWSEGGWDGLKDACMDFNAAAWKILNDMSDEDFKVCSKIALQKEIDLKQLAK